MFNSKKINALQHKVSLMQLDLHTIQNILKENNINESYPGDPYKYPCSLIGQKIDAILAFLKLEAKAEHADTRVVLTKTKTYENLHGPN
jgi:hypothetical protein